MVYYHVGKVLEIFSPKDKDVKSADQTAQALVETWDENTMTFLIEPKLINDLKEGDIVLLDYNPISEKLAMPKMVITKILYGEKARRTWEAYKEYFKKRPKVKIKAMPSQYPGIG